MHADPHVLPGIMKETAPRWSAPGAAAGGPGRRTGTGAGGTAAARRARTPRAACRAMSRSAASRPRPPARHRLFRHRYADPSAVMRLPVPIKAAADTYAPMECSSSLHRPTTVLIILVSPHRPHSLGAAKPEACRSGFCMKLETLNMHAGILRSGLLFVSGLRHAAVLTRMRICMCGKSRLRTEGVRGQGAALRECFQVAGLQLAVLAQRILQHACSVSPPLGRVMCVPGQDAPAQRITSMLITQYCDSGPLHTRCCALKGLSGRPCLRPAAWPPGCP